jgi:hypothetical protein
MAEIGAADFGVGEAPDRQDDTPARQLLQERPGGFYLCPRRAAIRSRLVRQVRVRRDDVPEEDVFLESEYPEDAVDDGRRRLTRAPR